MKSVVTHYLDNYRGIPAKTWQMIVLSIISTVASGLVFYLSIYFTTVIHLDITSAGFIISLYGLGTIAGAKLGGRIIDSTRSNNFATGCLMLEGLCFILLKWLTTVPFLAFNVFVMGMASYGFKLAVEVLVLASCKHNEAERLKAINILYIASNFGIGVSAFIVSVFATLGFDRIFLLAGSILFAAAISLMLQRQSVTPSIDKSESNTELNAGRSYIPSIYYFILSSVFLVGLVIVQRRVTYGIFIHDYFPSLGYSGLGLLYVLNPVMIITLQAPIVNSLGKYNKLVMTGMGAFGLGFGMLMLNFSHSYAFVIAACIIYTFGEMCFFSFAQLICYQMGPANKKGQALGSFKSLYASSVVIGPLAGSALYDHSGGGRSVWWLCGLIGLLCLLACMILARQYENES